MRSQLLPTLNNNNNTALQLQTETLNHTYIENDHAGSHIRRGLLLSWLSNNNNNRKKKWQQTYLDCHETSVHSSVPTCIVWPQLQNYQQLHAAVQHKWLSVEDRKPVWTVLYPLPLLPFKKSELLPQQILRADGHFICSPCCFCTWAAVYKSSLWLTVFTTAHYAHHSVHVKLLVNSLMHS